MDCFAQLSPIKCCLMDARKPGSRQITNIDCELQISTKRITCFSASNIENMFLLAAPYTVLHSTGKNSSWKLLYYPNYIVISIVLFVIWTYLQSHYFLLSVQLYTITTVVLVLQSLYYGHIYKWWKSRKIKSPSKVRSMIWLWYVYILRRALSKSVSPQESKRNFKCYISFAKTGLCKQGYVRAYRACERTWEYRQFRGASQEII